MVEAVPVAVEWVAEHRGEIATSSRKWADRPPNWFGAAVPYRWRWAHEVYAWCTRRFWVACPLCLRAFGGHEWADGIKGGYEGGAWERIERLPATIPIPAAERVARWQFGAAICPRCTRMRAGLMAWTVEGSRLATPAEVDDHRRPPYDDDGKGHPHE